ncbi:sugar ABC transporter ATP-binding protein [Nocardioides carbamazepini]|uniref:sugar ABC transporter ATP-binding protein n=1 Tax=Nocardioides carbamazepini TaxID=2854259 RepID=UPI00214A45D8|nr:sugar ABC transporter ATP-binding protein [Nocardioides carbamazepini]MCR1784018.1 sugar ABC transporter ATP-binding protein [Nocardioides carbamazepini]
MTAPAISFESVGKSFPGVVALDEVTFDVRAGQITSLLGENGAGKSTLLSVLGGEQQPDTGRIVLNGTPIELPTPSAARAAGIRVIHQEPQLAPGLTVAENVLLGHLPSRYGVVRRGDVERLCRDTATRIGVPLDPRAKVGSLGVAQRQMVEIVKALVDDVQVLALDEPTSSLSATEASQLFAVIEKLRGRGVAILYVSHRMEEVLAMSDAYAVLRDGRLITQLDAEGVSEQQLIKHMIGRDLTDVFARQDRQEPGDVALELEGLTTPSVGPVSLNVRRGEIVGLAGLVGSGRSRLVRALAGQEQAVAGSIRVSGRPLEARSAARVIDRGLAVCPEDRKKLALFLDRSVSENILIGRCAPKRLGILNDRRGERRIVDEYMKRLAVRPAQPSRPVRTLSGGNAQKVVLARWLAHRPDILVLDEPTRGIDIGAKAEIYALVRELAASGVAVLVASSELIELLGLADRIYVMRGGAVAGELDADEATEEAVMQLALATVSNSSSGKVLT